MGGARLDRILICGSGLAFETALAALAKNLDTDVSITALEITTHDNSDIFYGTVMPPTAYNDHLAMDLSEPRLLTQTDTVFCYGTHYENWAQSLDWTQSYQLPFPVWEGIEFHFYLSYLQATLEPYLVGAQCGQWGRFAHPPSDQNVPLSRAEYGYQFRPQALSALLAKEKKPANIRRVKGDIKHIHVKAGHIYALELSDGQSLTAQLFIDTTGPTAALMQALDNPFNAQKTVSAVNILQKKDKPGSALRHVRGQTYGWHARTNLRDHTQHLVICHPDQLDDVDPALTHHSDANITHIPIGDRQQGWVANCVGLGQVNSIAEPLTPAPIMMLYKDIERLLQLIPVTTDMSVEAKEYNRLLKDDTQHCDIFWKAFYVVNDPPNTPYWQEMVSQAPSTKLARKIAQFKSRGFLSSYDLEPFNKEDWTILHFGMKRHPERTHHLLDHADLRPIKNKLTNMEKSIQQLCEKVPPHDRYVSNFLRYLEKNNVT